MRLDPALETVVRNAFDFPASPRDETFTPCVKRRRITSRWFRTRVVHQSHSGAAITGVPSDRASSMMIRSGLETFCAPVS